MVELSEGFVKKFLDCFFSEYSDVWFKSVYSYCIDSKYRKFKRLDKTLKDQFENISEELYKEASNINSFKDVDKQMIEVLRYVKRHFNYAFDKNNYGVFEKWATADEIIEKGQDDCDGLNSLVYVLARLKGVPSYLLWNMIGKVRGGMGHYWLAYFSPKEGKLYSIDVTYDYDDSLISNRSVFKFSNYDELWYLFNEDYVFKPGVKR